MTRSSKNGLTMVRQTGLEPKSAHFLKLAYLWEKSKEVAYLCEKLKNFFSFFGIKILYFCAFHSRNMTRNMTRKSKKIKR